MSSKTQTYALMGVGALALVALAYIVYTGSSTAPEAPKKSKKIKASAPKKDAPKESSAKGSETLSPPADKPAAEPAAASPKAGPATVEDVDEEDEEEEEKKLRKTYDHTLKRAKQFLQGEKYTNAAALFSEAIELAGRIPSASKDVLALYNNRSAMYEKNGEFDSSIKDIMVVLAMDSKHLKARARRARIYEKQGNVDAALKDLVFCSIVEGASGIPQSSGPKVAELCKKVSVSEVAAIVERIRSSPSRNLPNKGYCRNFFEAFMTYHEWKRLFQSVDREDLVRRSYHAQADTTQAEGALGELRDIIDLIKVDLVSQEFPKAFAHISRASHLLSSEHLSEPTADTTFANALLTDLSGIEMHLRCNLSGAIAQYSKALKIISFGNLPALLSSSVAVEAGAVQGAASIETHQVLAVEIVLRLASAFIELGDKARADELYTAAFEATRTSEFAALNTLHAWVLIHRVTLHITRDELGNFSPTGVEDAVVDLEKALELTENVKKDPVVLQCHVMTLLKLVHVISQTKVQMGQQPTDVELEKVSAYIQQAKSLCPLNESVIMLDADLLSINGETDAALARCDEVILLSDKTDSIPYVIKANVMMQKALMEMQMAQMQQSQQLLASAQNTMREVENIFNEAIVIEPNGLEAFAQYAQLKSMLGELDTSLEYLEKALSNSRSKDEVQELCVMKVQTLAQQAAIEEYKSQM